MMATSFACYHKVVVLCPREQQNKHFQVSQRDDVICVRPPEVTVQSTSALLYSALDVSSLVWFRREKHLVGLKVQSEEFLTATTNMTTVEDVVRMYLPRESPCLIHSHYTEWIYVKLFLKKHSSKTHRWVFIIVILHVWGVSRLFGLKVFVINNSNSSLRSKCLISCWPIHSPWPP